MIQRPRQHGLLCAAGFGVLLLVSTLTSPAAADCDDDAPDRAAHFQRPRFQADVSACVEADSLYAILRVVLPYHQLSFRRSQRGLTACFDLIVHVYKQKRQVAGDVWSERIVISDRDGIHGSDARYVKDLFFDLEPGFHIFEVRVSEPTSGHEGVLCGGTDLPVRVPGRIELSTLLVGPCELEGSVSQLRRDARVRSEFTEPRDTLCAYIELYHAGVAADSVLVDWRLRTPRNETLHSGRRRYAAGDGTTRMTWPVPVKELWLEAYELQVVVRAGDQEAQAATRVSLLAETEEALAEFFRDLLGVLGYIASQEELERLRKAAPSERKQVWDEFWRSFDPTPESDDNEFKTEFIRRVRHANAEFGVLRPGWRTDRGRIYITHGAPDQISRDAYGAGSRAVEIWYYDQLGLRFDFVDRGGYGDFELTGSGR